MCLFIKKGCDITRAEKPIRGWKMILPVSKTEWAPIIMQGESYKYNEVLQAKKTYNYLRLRLGLSTETKQLPLEHLEMSWYHFGSCTVYKKIDAGFHAARNWWGAFLLHIRYKWCPDELLNTKEEKRAMKLVPIIIPEGAEYCLGEDGEIVAVNMIVFRSKRCYYWYRIKKLLKK